MSSLRLKMPLLGLRLLREHRDLVAITERDALFDAAQVLMRPAVVTAPEEGIAPSNLAMLLPYPQSKSVDDMPRPASYGLNDLFPREVSGRTGLAGDLDDAHALIATAEIAVERLHDEVRHGRAIETFQLDPLVDALAAFAARNPHALAAAARIKPGAYLAAHAVATAALMACFAEALALPPRERREATLTGLLQDVGMVVLPTLPLDAPGPLVPADRARMREHVALGEAYLATAYGLPDAVLTACRQHHERADGTGYPDRLAGTATSLLARMAAICDTYDAMTSPRPYRRTLPPTRALREMQRSSGFDQTLLDAFVAWIGTYPLGSLVHLRSGRMGVVKAHGGGAARRTVVTVFRSAPGGSFVDPVDVECGAAAAHGDAIIGAEDPDRVRLGRWEERWPAIATACDAEAETLPLPAVA